MNAPPGSVELVEGTTRLIVPRLHSVKGPGTRVGGVFYNGQMAFSRDISVCLLRAVRPSGWRVLDAMAGTGARGVRLAGEAGEGVTVHINDLSREAMSYIEANILLNRLENAFALNQDLRCLLARETFHYVDVDPFGTPAPFLQPALGGCRRGGMIAATATDTAPLAGTYPKKCVRRYSAVPVRSRFGHEVGLRILMGHMAREAARFDRGIDPVFCYYADHYMRVHLRLREGGARADASLGQLGFLEYDSETGRRVVSCCRSPSSAGPLWTGGLYDREVLSRMRSEPGLACPDRVEKFVTVCDQEIDVPLFYESDEIAHLMGGSPPSLDSIIQRLRGAGRASRTHFSPTGFKTDLSLEEIRYLLGDMI